MECEPAEDILIFTDALSWSLGCLSWPCDGGSGSSTDYQDTAFSENAETRLLAPAGNAAVAAADAARYATSLEADSLTVEPIQQLGRPLPSIASPGTDLPPQAALPVANVLAPACQQPQQPAAAALQPPAADSSPAGDARAQQPAEQQVPDSSRSGAPAGVVAPGTDIGKCPNSRKRRAGEDQYDQEQQQSGGPPNTRDKQNERKRDERRKEHIRVEVQRLWTQGKQQDAAAGAAQLDCTSGQVHQQMPPAEPQASLVVQPVPAAACCIEDIRGALAAALEAAGLAPEPMLQNNAVDWQQTRKAWANCMQLLIDRKAPAASESLTSLMGAVQQVLDKLWDAQPTLWRTMICTGRVSSVSAQTAKDIGQRLARLDLPKTTKRTFLTTALRQRDAVTDQATYWLQRTNVLEDLQAAAASGIDVSDRSCVMMLHTGFKAAELAASMKVVAMQMMEADRKLLHTVCFDRDAPDALSNSQAATIMVGMLNIGVDMATMCRMLQA